MLFRTTRQFIESAYPQLKKHNPNLPVLIREARGTPARVFARFGTVIIIICLAGSLCQHCAELGIERHVALDNLSAADVEIKVSELLSKTA